MRISTVIALIGANVVVFLLQGASRDAMDALFALWPLQPLGGEVHFRFWQVITYAFLHGSVSHLFFNMWGLWMFGQQIERTVGGPRFLLLYFASVLTAALAQLIMPILLHADPAPTIGASGGVFGVLLAYACLFPKQRIMLLIPPIPMPAWLFATLYAGLELFLGVTGRQMSVAHFAHLGGMVGSGIVLLWWLNRLKGGRGHE